MEFHLTLQDLIDDDLVIAQELSLLAFNIRREVCGILYGLKKKKV